MSWLAEAATRLKYSPDQPRDDHGRFGEGSAAPLFERLMQPDGGFTVNMLDGSEVSIGTPKYAVSMPGNEAALKAADVKSPLDIYKYIQAHQEELAKPGNFFGGWHDPASHTLYLDVSRVVDTPEAAAQAARENHQIAYFDFKQGQSVTVDEGTHHGKAAPHAHARHQEGQRGKSRSGDGVAVHLAQGTRTQQDGPRRVARAGGAGLFDASLTTLARTLKFDESQHPRDEMGRFADDGGPAGDDSTDTGTTEMSAAQLQHQADDAIKNIEKHLDVAVAQANYDNVPGGTEEDDDPAPVEPVWDDYDANAKDAAAMAFYENDDTYYQDAYEQAKKDVIEELAKENDDMLAAADSAVVDSAKDSPLFTEQAELLGETLHLTLDKNTILSNDDAEETSAPSLDLAALRTVSGKELTSEQRDFVEREWTNAYEQAFKDKLESSKVEDDINERASEAENQAKDDHWSNLSDAEKLDYIPDDKKSDYEINTDNHPDSDFDSRTSPAEPGLPGTWRATFDPALAEGSPIAKEDYQRTSAIAQKLVELRTQELLTQRGLVEPGGHKAEQIAREVSGEVWDSWKSDSHANTAMAMQLATAREFDGLHRLTPEQEKAARETASEKFAAYGMPGAQYGSMGETDLNTKLMEERGLSVLQAYTRAQWETTQFVLTKAGVNNMQLYRGLMLDDKKIGPDVEVHVPGSAYSYATDTAHHQLTQMQMQRGALQSTSLSLGVANGWGGVGHREGNTKVTVRFDVPKTSVFSLPVFGKNVQGEQEVVVAGFKDHWKWDAWKGSAPSAEKFPIKMATKKSAQRFVLDLGQIEITHPYWLADKKGKWARIPMHKELDTLADVLKYSPDQPRDDHGRFGEGDGGAGGDHADAGSHVGGVVPGDREKFRALKTDWARTNNSLLAYMDNPTAPAALAKMDHLKAIVKEMYTLRADPGGLDGIGLPGGPRDITIVGAGPGGLAAAVMGGTDGLDTLLIDGNTTVGGQSKYSSRIENYPGFPVGVTGEKLSQAMYDQAQRVGADSKLGVRVTGVAYDEKTGMKTLTLANGDKVESRAVIIAGGVEFRKMDFEGSNSPSVVYGDYKAISAQGAGKSVVILGGSNAAAQAALGAAQTASSVAVLSRSPIERGMSDYQVQALRSNPKISVHEGEEMHKLVCDNTNHAQALVTSKGTQIDCHVLGVFVGSAPNTAWVPSSIKTHESGKIHVDPNYETSMPGVYAVGDVRHGSIGRIGAAVGEGQMAAKGVFDYFNKLQSKRGQH